MVDMGTFLSPKNFSSVRISQLKSSDPKTTRIKTYLFENFSQKKDSRKFQATFLGQKSIKNGQLYHFLDVRKSQERQASKKLTTHVPKILDLKANRLPNRYFPKIDVVCPCVVLSSIIRSIELAPEMFCIAVLLIYFYFSSLNLVSRMHILTCPEFTEYKLSHFFLSPAINDWINKRVEVNKRANRQLNRVPSRLRQLPSDLCPKISR